MNSPERSMRKLRAHEIHADDSIRVIAITGKPTHENVSRLLEAGAEHCLGKPLDYDNLLAILGLMDLR